MPISRHALIGIALLLGMIVVGIGLLLMPHALPPGPADMLPADNTWMLSIRPDEELIASLQERGWIAQNIPADPYAVASIRGDDASTATVVFMKNDAKPNVLNVAVYPPSAQALLTGALLSRDPGYRALAQEAHRVERWTYVRSPSLLLHGAPSIIDAPTPPLSLHAESGGSVVRAYIPSGDTARPFAIPSLTEPTPALSLESASLDKLLSAARAWVTSDHQPGMDALLDRTLHGVFPASVSLRFDVLPLLRGHARIDMRKDEQDRLTMRIVTEATKEHESRIAALHEAHVASLSSIVRTARTFENDLQSDDVRIDPSAISDMTNSRNGWTVRFTQHRPALSSSNGSRNDGLYSACDNKMCILSNHRGWLEQSLASSPQPATDALVARLEARPNELQQLLHRLFAPLWPQDPPALLQRNDRLTLDAVRKGDLIDVRIPLSR